MGAKLMTRPKPEYEIGDYLTIYCGLNEGCCFTVRGREWREQSHVGGYVTRAGWYYDTGSYGWRAENTISTEAHARLFP